MVKITETVVSAYCDFCPNTRIENEDTKAAYRREPHRAFLKCCLCNRDLCRKHCYLVAIPKDFPTEEKGDEAKFWRDQSYIRSELGDGRICPECSSQPLNKIGLLLLRSFRKKYDEEKKYHL